MWHFDLCMYKWIKTINYHNTWWFDFRVDLNCCSSTQGWCFPDTKLCLNTTFYFLMLFMPQKASLKNWDLSLKCWWKPEKSHLKIIFSLYSVLYNKRHVLMMLNGFTSFLWNRFLCVWLSPFIFMQKYTNCHCACGPGQKLLILLSPSVRELSAAG